MTNRPNHPRLTELCVVLASFVAAVVVKRSFGDKNRRLRMTSERSDRPLGTTSVRGDRRLRITNHVSRQSPNSGRRKGTVEGPGRVQAGNRREVRTAILHHKSRWEGCSSVSLRRMGADRTEAGWALHFQSDEEKVSGQGELLRADGGDGWAGPALDPAVVAGSSADQRRGCGYRQSNAPDCAQPGFVSQTGRGRKVHA